MGGKRYSKEPKLNIKKVIGVLVGIAVIIMFVITLTKLLKDSENTPKIKENKISYYTVYTQNKWGVIDNNGNIVIEPTYEEMILIPNKEKPVFICTYDVNYEENTYKTKAINEKAEEILTGYESIEAIANKDSSGKTWYENAYKILKDGKYGAIDEKGKEILPCNYDKIEALTGLKDYLLIKKEGKVGLASIYGNIILNTEYKSIKIISEENQKEFIVENEEGKFGIVASDKSTVLETKYQDIKQINAKEIYAVKEADKLAVINKDNSINVTGKFTDIKDINDTNIIIKNDNKFGIINTSGEEKINTEYEDLVYAFGENYIAKKNGKYGIINLNNETKLEFNYNTLTYYKNAQIFVADKDDLEQDIINDSFEVKLTGFVSDINEEKGYIRIREDGQYNYYNFKFEQKKNTEVLVKNTIFLDKKDGKYGYINNKGEVIVDYIYDDATEQNTEGFVSVNKDGKWGSLDKEGKACAETTYDLTNNKVIDFIGKWHIGIDPNVNYYTDI